MFEQFVAPQNEFLRDVNCLRERARSALPASGSGICSASRAIELLQSLLATEIICVLRYTLLALSGEGLRNEWLAREMMAQASDERRHMGWLAQRIEALGGTPDYDPPGLNARIAGFDRAAGFLVRLQQNLAAERCVVEHYRELVTFFSSNDMETVALLEKILQDEEDHANDMQDLLVSCFG